MLMSARIHLTGLTEHQVDLLLRHINYAVCSLYKLLCFRFGYVFMFC